jgi:hypothetical protein
MAEAEMARRAPRQLAEMRDVYDLLEEVRQRPGMRVRGRSLQHLNSMLLGYRVALAVHGAEEPFDFWTPGDQSPFDAWLTKRMDEHTSLGWSTVIEREAEAAGRSAMELFFELLDEFRAGRDQPR